jgi:hypothetical protein
VDVDDSSHGNTPSCTTPSSSSTADVAPFAAAATADTAGQQDGAATPAAAAAKRPVAASVLRAVVRPVWGTATLPLRILVRPAVSCYYVMLPFYATIESCPCFACHVCERTSHSFEYRPSFRGGGVLQSTDGCVLHEQLLLGLLGATVHAARSRLQCLSANVWHCHFG